MTGPVIHSKRRAERHDAHGAAAIAAREVIAPVKRSFHAVATSQTMNRDAVFPQGSHILLALQNKGAPDYASTDSIADGITPQASAQNRRLSRTPSGAS
jgi:hypothetical protein